MKRHRLVKLSRSPEDTQNIGKQLGTRLGPGHMILLNGDLGAGKTCFTQGVLWGLGGKEYARSPTFVMVVQYVGRLTLNHIDLYRVESPEELPELGLNEYLQGDGVTVVEWADRAPGLSQEDHLGIHIQYISSTERRLTLSASTTDYIDMLRAIDSEMTKAKY